VTWTARERVGHEGSARRTLPGHGLPFIIEHVMPVMIRYNIDVSDAPCGADFSFVLFSARLLQANDIVEDDQGRSYVIVSVSDQYSADPNAPDLVLGSASARPA
jgi:hypothetical protein